MTNLDDPGEARKLDKENILRNIREFPEQIERCLADWQKIPLPTGFIQAKNIVIGGMGGSGIGGALARDLAKDAKIPIYTWSNYGIPSFLNRDSLVIAVSYSGNTEETIDFLKKAAEKTRKIVTISSGGRVASLATNYRTPHYEINYGSEPRAALGYLFTSVLAIFSKLDILKISDDDWREALIILKGQQKKIAPEMSSGANQAKILAGKIHGKIPIIYGSGALTEVARRWKGEFNENAKNAAYYEIIPELNHNSLVGLQFPAEAAKNLFVIILQSKFDHERNRLRQIITAQILDKFRLNHEFVLLEPSPTPLSEMLQVIHFGDFTSYYLALLNRVAPNPVEIIGYLKDKLAEKHYE